MEIRVVYPTGLGFVAQLRVDIPFPIEPTPTACGTNDVKPEFVPKHIFLVWLVHTHVAKENPLIAPRGFAPNGPINVAPHSEAPL